MMIKKCLLVITIGMILCISPLIADEEQEPILWVDAGSSIGEISPYVYGANYGLLNVIPFDLYPLAEISGIRYLRFPGGRVGDTTDIQKFQLDQFIALCRFIGAEPSISVRLENGTPEKAAAMVEYVNVTKGYGVKYWSIGNEPNLFDNYTTDQHNRDWRAIAQAMLEVDPNIIFVGPDISQFTGIDSYEGIARAHLFLREFLRYNGDMIDIVSVHRYPFPQNNQRATIETLRQDIYTWDDIISNLRQVVQEETGKELPLAFTEVNSDWSANIGTEATPDSFFNAIWWSAVLTKLINADVSIVAYFNMQTSDQLGGHGLFARYNVRPTYYVYQLFQKLGTQRLDSGSTISRDVLIIAAKRDDGSITIILTNVTDETLSYPLTLLNSQTDLTNGEYWLFDSTHQAVMREWHDAVQNGVVTLPSQSITLLVIYS